MTNSLFRTTVISLSVLGAFAIGWYFSSGNSTPIFLLLGFILFALIQRAHQVNPEAIIISVLFIGYIVGNRGFAQLNFFGIFIGELAMVGIFSMALLHLASSKKIPFHLDFIGIVILIFISSGAIRLLFDFKIYRIDALRDFATCYYAAFYFLIQPILLDKTSSSLVHRSLGIAFILILPAYVLFDRFPEFFLSNLLVNGIPLIYYKYDLVACFLGCAFFYFYYHFRQKEQITHAILGCLAFLLMLSTTSRAALPGFAIGCLLFFLAGWRHLPRFLLISIFVAAIPYFYFVLASDKPFYQSKAVAIFEHAISVVDVNGTYDYRNPEASNSGDNNRYRLEWWKNVIQETTHHNPLFGLGFGYDLTSRFLDDYYGDVEMEFSVRSPHSIFLTLFGRMGIWGFFLFMTLLGLIAIQTLQALRRTRAENEPNLAILYFAMVWMIMGSSTFGVVLEGPMGAIPFWSFLAIANHYALRRDDDLA